MADNEKLTLLTPGVEAMAAKVESLSDLVLDLKRVARAADQIQELLDGKRYRRVSIKVTISPSVEKNFTMPDKEKFLRMALQELGEEYVQIMEKIEREKDGI